MIDVKKKGLRETTTRNEELASLVTSASNAISFGPPSPAPEKWLVAARIPPEYAPNFSGKNSLGNGSFKRCNG